MKGGTIIKEFEEVYKEYYKDVFAFLYKTCGSDYHLAEELTQDTFCEAYRCFYKYNGSCSIYTWLCAIGKNVWFHYLRKHKDNIVGFETLEETICDDYEKTPEAYYEHSENSVIIKKALESLGPKYREVIWLRSVADLPFAEIASLMNITESSAKVLFFRAKKMIKEKLENEGLF